ncbi:MAG: hypothetical protein AMXMBFR64_51450 [Myxococcales bacterium]
MSRKRPKERRTDAPGPEPQTSPGVPSDAARPPDTPATSTGPAPSLPAKERPALLRRAHLAAASLAVAALLLPWGSGPFIGALGGGAAVGNPISPGLAWFSALLTLLLACTSFTRRSTTPRLDLTRGVVATLAMWSLYGVSQSGVSTLLDPWDRGVAGVPAPLLMTALGAALLSLADAPSSLAARVVAAGSALLVAGLLVSPQWPGGTLTIPVLAMTDPTSPLPTSLLGLALVAALALVPLALRPRPPLNRALGVVTLLHPVLWLAVTGAPWAAVAAALAAAITVATTAHALATSPPQLVTTARAAEALAVATTFALYALLKTHGLRAADGDENIYFYMAHLLAEGQLPYRDFFFAHPPVHLLVPAALFKVFGFTLLLAKSIAPLAAAGAGAFAWALARRRFGAFAALLTLGAFLFASELLKASTNLTGVNLTLLFSAGGTWAALTDRLLLGGALFGLAASTGFYAMAGFAVLLATLPFRGLRPTLRFAAGFAVVFGAINLTFWAIGGQGYVDGVYRYHLLKAAKDPDQLPLFGSPGGPIGAVIHNFGVFLRGKELQESLYYHGSLFWTAVLAPLPLLARVLTPAAGGPRSRRLLRLLDPRTLWDGTPEGAARLLYLVAFGYFLQLSMFKELYDFYFVLPFAALAPLAAFTLTASASLVTDGLARLRDGLPAGRAWLGVAVLALTLAASPLRHRANAKAWPEEQEAAGTRVDFRWIEPPVLPSLSGVVHLLFWRDHRVRGELQPGPAHYLWSKKRWFSTAEAIAAHIRDTTPPDATILGASTTTPLIALLAGRAIAANEVDTNSKRFKTGISRVEGLFRRACDTKLAILVSTPRSLFAPESLSRMPPVRDFALDRTFDDPALLHFRAQRILLLRRKGDLSAPPPVCTWSDR